MKSILRISAFVCALIAIAGCSEANKQSIDPVHWDLTEIVSPSSLRIAAYIGSSSCNAFESFNVSEDESQVEITVLAKSSGADACTSDLRIKEIDISLSAPLGDRDLVGCLPFPRDPGVPDLGCRQLFPGFGSD